MITVPLIKNKKILGYIEDRNFTKTVYGSKHFLKKPPAIAIDRHALLYAIQKGINQILIMDKETQTIYRSTIEVFMDNRVVIERGFGTQYALQLKYWDRITKGESDGI